MTPTPNKDGDVNEYLIHKYGYRKGVSPNPTIVNRRIIKALEHKDLFYDSEKERLKRDVESNKRSLGFMFKFIQECGLEDKWKKECLKELII